MRLKVIRLIIIFLFSAISLNLVYHQIIKGYEYRTTSHNNSIRVVSLDGQRGKIYDRNGTVIAGNRVSFDVMVIPQDLRNKDELFSYLGQKLNVDKEKLLKSYKRKYIAPFSPVMIMRDVDRETAIVLEENRFRFPGLLIKDGLERHYVYGETNAHLLGYVGKINRSRITRLKDYGYNLQSIVGYSGIEEYYDNYLRGEDGGMQLEVNNRGEQTRVLGIKDSTAGEDVTLTVDQRIQQMAVESLDGKKGAIVMLDWQTGEVLGMVSSPSYDPNFFVSGKPEISAYFSDSNAPLLNRAIGGQYPPGSTFKIPVAISALENKKITPNTSFTCPGFYQLGRRQFRCSHIHGLQDFHQAIAHSCNVYFYNVGLIVGPEIMMHFARLLGLGEKTGVDLPSEASGNIPGHSTRAEAKDVRWYKGNILNASIGQGSILATPMQMARMISVIAKDGENITPYVLKSIGPFEVERNVPKSRMEISEKTLSVLKPALKDAVEDPEGTARVLRIDGLEILGKTGTAQSSGNQPTHAWFVGFCPSAKTKIAFCVFLEFGGSSYHACVVAHNLLLKMKEQGIL